MLRNFQDIREAARKEGKKRIILTPSGPEGGPEALYEAVRDGWVTPVFIGEGSSTDKTHDFEIINERDPRKCVMLALDMVRGKKMDIVMQGAVEHQLFLDLVLDREKGLLQGRVASLVSVFDPPAPDRLTMITDAYINNNPSITEKIAITENAIKLARVLGIGSLKIAALSAIEQVNPAIPSTMDAAILAKMAERKQFGDVIIEGPLDMDCAASEKAAARKGVQSQVTGKADIYLAPNVEAGYLMAQIFVFIAGMPMAGILMGTTHPVIVDLPITSGENKLVEIALAVLLSGK
ncbi:MAG: phosphate acyltransferase [Deltaproteobacteria bacterium]|nr:phosphate acyltransferase [Deltaproteobacteria bacterium]